MVNALGLLYIAAVTLLFFFWVYGLVAFVRDSRQKYVPALKRYLTARREQKEQAKRDAERAESERNLY